MKIPNHLKQKLSLPFVLGLCDGIITVLTFIASRLVKSNELLTLNFAIKISIAAFVTGIFTYSVSQYTELRRQLLHTEKELNLTTSGQLATTALGKQIIFESFLSALIGGLAAFFGALIPTLIAISMQKHKWASVLSATLVLGILGIFLAQLVNGNKLVWALALTISGLFITYIGMQLSIVT